MYTRTYWKSAEDHGVLLADWPADCRHTTYMTELVGTPESVLIMGVYASIWFTEDRDDVVSRTSQCVSNSLEGMEEARRVVDHMSKCLNGGDW